MTIVTLWTAHHYGITTQQAKETALNSIQYLEHLASLNPGYLIIAIALLPAIGVPISALFLAAGIAYGAYLGILYSLIGVSINLIITYCLARRYLHNFIQKILHQFNYKIPQVPGKHHWKFVLVMRLIPAPIAIQTYIMGIAQVSFLPFFWISIAYELLYMTGIIVTAGSAMSGNFSVAIGGICFIIIVAIIFKLARNHYSKSKNAKIVCDTGQ